MTRKRIFLVLNLLVLIIGVAMLWYHVQLQWQRRPPVWPTVSWPLALASTVLALMYGLAYGIGWHLITRVMGIVTRLWIGLSVWGYSILGKYVPGNVVLVAYRIAAYVLRANARPQQVAAAIAIESAFSVLAGLILLSLVMTLTGFELLDRQLRGWQLALGTGLIIAAGLFMLVPRVKHALFRLLRLEDAVDTVGIVRLAGLLGYYVAAWTLISLSFWLLCLSFGISVLSWSMCAAIYAAAGLSGILAVFAPSGMGVREGVMVALLSQSVPVETAIAVALASRLNTLISDLLAICVGLAGLRVLTSLEQANGARS